MKKQVTIYSIMWPRATEPHYAMIEMPEMGCVTIGEQVVELDAHTVPDNIAELMEAARINRLRMKAQEIIAEIGNDFITETHKES